MPTLRAHSSGQGACDRMEFPTLGRQGTAQMMLEAWVVIAVALGYIGLLFVIATYGDQTGRLGREGRWRRFIYPLSLAIYCTSWTFFGSVGLASRTGFDFLTIYLGPMLMIGLFFFPVLRPACGAP